jgi:hypothetical protein
LSHQGRHEEYSIIEVNLLLAVHKQAIFHNIFAQNYQISLARNLPCIPVIYLSSP